MKIDDIVFIALPHYVNDGSGSTAFYKSMRVKIASIIETRNGTQYKFDGLDNHILSSKYVFPDKATLGKFLNSAIIDIAEIGNAIADDVDDDNDYTTLGRLVPKIYPGSPYQANKLSGVISSGNSSTSLATIPSNATISNTNEQELKVKQMAKEYIEDERKKIANHLNKIFK